MTTPNLAKIERVDLREAWPNEARDFTPWLADNIAELGEALGMDLELQETEASVGDYSLDVLATDRDQNRPVIIENQLEATNHAHLGQLLTYAAGYDANVIVWLTREFRDEHRAALDWLNQRTGDETQFFGVVLELFQIGESPFAPYFKLVSAPNEWGKRASGNSSGESSERQKLRRTFYQKVVEKLRAHPEFYGIRDVSAAANNWWSIPSGYRGVSYRVSLSQRSASVSVYVDNGNAEWNFQFFDDLAENESEIATEIGETLDWRRLDNRRACRVVLSWPSSVQENEDTLSEIQDWAVNNLLKFKQVFGPRLAQLVR